MALKQYCLGLAWLLAGTAAAYGQAAEAGLSFGAGIFTDKDLGNLSGSTVREALTLDSGFRLSGRFNINSRRFLGHEIAYSYQRSKLVFGSQGDVGMTIHNLYYDLLLHALPEGSVVRPFVCGGGGFSTFYPPGASVFAGNGVTKFGYNYGAGVKIRVSPIYGVRLDVRDHVTGKPFDLPDVSGRLHNVEVSAGFAILF
jgi:hypothetical protein